MEKYNANPTLDEKILKILKNCNFSRDDIGTIFYMEVIKRIVVTLRDCDEEEKINLQKQTENAHSLFYYDIAKGIPDNTKDSNSIDSAPCSRLDTLHKLIRKAAFKSKLTRGNEANSDKYLEMAYHFGKVILSIMEFEETDIVKESLGVEEDVISSEVKPKVRVLKK